ncbi:MAG: hypothetical protein HY879_16645 [Deltaproteobacteria bacterium]|nr:hypothetical protein [Deltaproteobacteria bacterium]
MGLSEGIHRILERFGDFNLHHCLDRNLDWLNGLGKRAVREVRLKRSVLPILIWSRAIKNPTSHSIKRGSTSLPSTTS